MAKALIVYATRTGETERIAELIAEGLRISGVETDMVKAGDVKKAAELEPYDALLFGAPTYHGDMIQGMKTFLFLAENANLAGKAGGAFGAFGWSGEAPDRIYDTMKHIFKMNMVGQALRLKSSTLGGGVQMAQEYGKSIAAMLKK
ncbi:flavodoxin domain-containing protein [Desulfatirhabdium butyrativorans]|uniref:flavodoxin domain-containing protein n=1 Tax=Desulfatirhabdium butyrativorans TaxID=340467 RepID=UPI0004194018|nr:flavodoxin domain-containing protein [Desulfatirhabdium butyrativorans]